MSLHVEDCKGTQTCLQSTVCCMERKGIEMGANNLFLGHKTLGQVGRKSANWNSQANASIRYDIYLQICQFFYCVCQNCYLT